MRKKSNKTKGLQYEKVVASLIKKHTNYNVVSKTIGSGCFWHSKGDLIISDKSGMPCLLEIKGTAKNEYRLSAKKIAKIWNEALEDSKMPLFAILLEGQHTRRLALMEIGMMNCISLSDKKTYLLNKNKMDEWEEGKLLGNIVIRDDDRTWVLDIKVIKEKK